MHSSRLSVVIVGGGIAGLAAGIALRPFADVTILESARELKPVGAAVTLGSGAVHILRSWGIHLEEWEGTGMQAIRLYNAEGQQILSIPYKAREQLGEHVFVIHRADLHEALLTTATSDEGLGRPCEILLNSKVAYVDPSAGIVKLLNGERFTADVVIGADGIRSVIRPFVTGSSQVPVPAGESAYRMLISVDDLKARRSQLVNASGIISPETIVIRGHERKIVAYPCRGGRFLNVVAFVPDTQMHETSSDRWTAKGDVDALLQSFSGFAPAWKDILACSKDVAVWQMRDMDPLKTWVKGRTIVIGDAAHPMLPHQAGGAISGIEDAEALGACLSGISRDGVNPALQKAFRIRFKRAARFQLLSHDDGIKTKRQPTIKDQMWSWDYTGARRWEAEQPSWVLREGENAVYVLQDL